MLFVVGAVVSGSAGALGDPGYPWQSLHAAVGGPQELCVALPILAFGFQVGCTWSSLCHWWACCVGRLHQVQ